MLLAFRSVIQFCMGSRPWATPLRFFLTVRFTPFTLTRPLKLLSKGRHAFGTSWLLRCFYFIFVCAADHYTGKPDDVKDPVILWWTPFTKQVGRSRMCGKRSCFFTEDRLFFNHSRLHVSLALHNSAQVFPKITGTAHWPSFRH